VSALWAASPTLRLSLGVEGTQDDSNIYWSALGRRQHYVYENRASTTQILWSPGFGNLDLGVRHDQNSEYGSATSPRLAFTKATDGWHVKFLVAGAFRAPSIENLFVNPDLRPERTLSYEAEVGHTLAPGYYLSANLFFMRVHDPISYAISPGGKNTYLNFDYTGAEGLELQLKGRHPTLTVEASLSYARARDHQAEFYRVEGREDAHVGFPALSATGQVQWRFAEGWSFNPSLRLLGTRYGYRLGETRATAFGRCALLDLYLVRTFGDHLRGGLLVSNALDADQPVLQPYGTPGVGGSPPLPGARREVDLRVSFRF